MQNSDEQSDWHKAMEKALASEEYQAVNREYRKEVDFEGSPRYQSLLRALGDALKRGEQKEDPAAKAKVSQLKIDSVMEKFASVEYHYSNYSRIESLAIGLSLRMSSIMPKWPTPQTMAQQVRKLNFETEAFIFQTRACLDVLTGSIMAYFEVTGKRRNVLKLRKRLDVEQSNEKSKDIVKMIDSHSSLISELVTTSSKVAKRDTIAHYGVLNYRSLNVIRHPTGQVSIIPQTESSNDRDPFSSESQLVLMKRTMDELFEMIHETYEIILEAL